MITQRTRTNSGELAAPEGCLWTSRNHDRSMTPATTKPYHTSRLSLSRTPLRAQITCDPQERTFRAWTSFHPVLDPHPQMRNRKPHKQVPSGSLDTSYIQMWRTPYQKMMIKMSLNFHQPIPNGGGQHRHLQRGPHFMLNTTPLRHHSVQMHSSDRYPSQPNFLFVSFVPCACNRALRDFSEDRHPVMTEYFRSRSSTLCSNTCFLRFHLPSVLSSWCVS
jgi:hypothetical protein